MKCVTILVLANLAIAPVLFSENRPTVRRDTHFPVILQTEISVTTAKIGDRIILRTTEGVLIGNNVVVPRGAEVVGTVDAIQQPGPDIPDSTLVIRFRSVRWPEGETNLNAIVSSVEVTTQSERLFFRHIHNLFSRPTMLEHINVYAHVERSSFTEFTSAQGQLVLHPGIRLVLRQIDPDQQPERLGRNSVLDVNRSWKN